MARFATGKFAWSICDCCGLRFRYTEMRTEAQTKMRKCSDCLDDPYPYWGLLRPPDPVALRHPRPDRKEPYPPGSKP